MSSRAFFKWLCVLVKHFSQPKISMTPRCAHTNFRSSFKTELQCDPYMKSFLIASHCFSKLIVFSLCIYILWIYPHYINSMLHFNIGIISLTLVDIALPRYMVIFSVISSALVFHFHHRRISENVCWMNELKQTSVRK